MLYIAINIAIVWKFKWHDTSFKINIFLSQINYIEKKFIYAIAVTTLVFSKRFVTEKTKIVTESNFYWYT